MATPITVLIVDDHPIVNDAVSLALIGQGYRSISVCSAKAMFHYLDEHRPDLLILDIDLPDGDGLELIGPIRQYGPLPILVFSGRTDPLTIVASERTGANGFFGKASGSTALILAIETILAGGSSFPSRPSGSSIFSELGPRDYQTIDLLMEGCSNLEIATELSLAKGTVKNKVTKLLLQFQVASREKLIAELRRLGYRPRAGCVGQRATRQ